MPGRGAPTPTDDRAILHLVYQLWGALRLRNPASEEDLATKDKIRYALEVRFGIFPKRPLLSPATLPEPVPSFTPEGSYAIFWNERLVHGNALKKHAHPHETPHGDAPGSRGYFVHLHGNQSHGRGDE